MRATRPGCAFDNLSVVGTVVRPASITAIAVMIAASRIPVEAVMLPLEAVMLLTDFDLLFHV